MRIHGSLAAMARAAGGAGLDSPEATSSMESAKEEQGALAIEDIAASEGALVVASQALLPHGPPTTYGPQRRDDGRSKKDGKGHGTSRQVEVNPFWSQTIKDEAMLRAMRPAGLPDASTSTARPTASGGEEMGVDIQEVLRAVMSQNSMLKRELAELKKKVDDSYKEKDRDFKEASRPKPPTSTPPPSPPSGPPPDTPEAEKGAGTTSLGAIPEFPGNERRGEPGKLSDPVQWPPGSMS